MYARSEIASVFYFRHFYYDFQHTGTVVLPISPVSIVIDSNTMSNLIELQSWFHKQLQLGQRLACYRACQ